jgi:hypothetical protein
MPLWISAAPSQNWYWKRRGVGMSVICRGVDVGVGAGCRGATVSLAGVGGEGVAVSGASEIRRQASDHAVTTRRTVKRRVLL